MRVNIDAVNNLIISEFRNNRSFFAEKIGVNREYLSAILNGKVASNSPKVCSAIISFCKINGLNYENYIILCN